MHASALPTAAPAATIAAQPVASAADAGSEGFGAVFAGLMPGASSAATPAAAAAPTTLRSSPRHAAVFNAAPPIGAAMDPLANPMLDTLLASVLPNATTEASGEGATPAEPAAGATGGSALAGALAGVLATPLTAASLQSAATGAMGISQLVAGLAPGAVVREPTPTPTPATVGPAALMLRAEPPGNGAPTLAERFLTWLDAAQQAVPELPAAGTSPHTTSAAAPDAAALLLASPSHAPTGEAAPTSHAATATLAGIGASAAVAPPAITDSPALVSAPPLPIETPDWPQRLGEQIQWQLGAGVQEARIEVSPRDLGPIDVRLSMDGDGLRVHLAADHAQTRELLRQDLPRLREALQEGGLQLADAQVGQDASRREPEATPNMRRSRDGDEALAVETAAPPARWMRRLGLLDDYA